MSARAALFLSLALVVGAALGRAQDGAADDAVETRRGEVVAALELARADLAAAADEAARERLEREVDLLQRLDVVLGQRLAAAPLLAGTLGDADEERAALERLRLSGPLEPRPWELGLLETLRDELAREEAHDVDREAAVERAREAREDASRELDEAEAAWRLAREDADDAAAAREADRARELALHRLELRRVELEVAEGELEAHGLRIAFLRETLAVVEPEVRFTRADLDEQLARIGEREAEVRRRQASADIRLQSAEESYRDVEGRWMAAAEPTPALDAEKASKEALRALWRTTPVVLGTRLERLGDEREAWRRRHALAAGEVLADELITWRADAAGTSRALDRAIEARSREVVDLRARGADLAERRAGLGLTPEANWLRQHGDHLASHVALLEEDLASLSRARELVVRLAEELGGEEEGRGLELVWTGVWRRVQGVWAYELASVDDRAITVGKVVVGILILVVGIWLSRRVSGGLVRWLLARFSVDKGAVAAIRSLVFYALVLTCGLLALRVVNVPLTAFTILGGALAIGVGFGSQNIVNNFISGLILLAERPISVGNVIQLGDLFGIVEHIGARSTRVRTGDNVEILVPNSSFLENNVVNWTLSSSRIRTFVSVGVAYGSPTREVQRILLKAATEHGKVLEKPEKPFVVFREFGDNALVFEVYFWIEVRRIMDRVRVESDVRFILDARFRDAGITVAFPQRDVHLDVVGPVRVHLDDPPSATPAEAREAATER